MPWSAFKIFIGLAIFFLTANVSNGQIKKPGITIGGSLLGAVPQGNFKNAYSFGAGAEVFGGIGLGNTFIIATLGYSAYEAKSNAESGTLTYKPIKVGIKQFLLLKRLFINGDIGVASVKNKNYNASVFTSGIGAGVRLLGIEVGLYYDGWKNPDAGGFSNSVAGKLSYSISL